MNAAVECIAADNLTEDELAAVLGWMPRTLQMKPGHSPPAPRRALLLAAVNNRYPGGLIPVDSVPIQLEASA